MIRSHLARVNRYIAELRADIVRERVIIEHALDAGCPSAVAESMLHALEGALRIFEKHRGLILDELERQTVRVGGEHTNAPDPPTSTNSGRRLKSAP
jgi:hypothetical protein